ncbi:hypothetical protein YC2023_045395 [Brassica napus]
MNQFPCFRYFISGRYYFGLPSEGTEKLDGDHDIDIQYNRGLFRALRLTPDGLHLNAGKTTNLFSFYMSDISNSTKKVGTKEKVTYYFTSRYSLNVEYQFLHAIRIENDAYVSMEQATAFRKSSVQPPARRESTIKSMVRIDKKPALGLVNEELHGVMSVSDQLASQGSCTSSSDENDQWSTGNSLHLCKFLNASPRQCRQQPVTSIISCQPEKIEDALREIHKKAANLQILIVILPDTTGKFANWLVSNSMERSKRYVTHSLALSHSVFREKNAFKQKNSLESLALKINLKPTIIFGADVTHPTEAGQLSLAAV